MVKARRLQRKTANASEIAKLLGVNTTTVLDWVKRGCPTALEERVGRKTHRVFDVAAVREWRKRDLARRKKPRTEVKKPLSLPRGLMSKKEDDRFRRIFEGLLRSANE